VNLIKKEKRRVTQELQKLSFVRAVYASDSNFVLFEVRGSGTASRLCH
jgi:histidinol-phosphate/aromatic aminotransferase/cobyric acid decarboxylase-like protein